MTPSVSISAALQWLDSSQIDQYLRCQQPSKLFHGPGGELWKSVCRIGMGKAKGGSKCPGPELKEKACHGAIHALPGGNLVNRVSRHRFTASYVFTMCMEFR